MAEPFKFLINTALIKKLAESIQRVDQNFEVQHFLRMATHDLDALELKARVQQVATALDQCLPVDFAKASGVLRATLADPSESELGTISQSCESGLSGWIIWPLTEWVVLRAPPMPVALDFLHELTQRFSSEFAVRPFIQANPEAAIGHLSQWINHPNPHVRRWLSEGSRPRLPWGMRLDVLIKRPELSLELIAPLFADSSEYVRRSVANHLNDVSKDHPELAVLTCRQWLHNSPGQQSNRLVKHALRSLVKKGHAGAIELLGFQSAEGISLSDLALANEQLAENEHLSFRMTLHNSTDSVRKLSLDYAIHYLKANGKHQAKVFKWKILELPAHSVIEMTNRHHLKRVTIRKHYPGMQILEILLNGQPVGSKPFFLAMNNAT